jgi:hypothetical protein
MDLLPGEYECPRCQGSMITRQMQLIPLFQACDKCGGTGKVDWVRNVVSSPSREPTSIIDRGAVMSNIHILRNLIIEEGMKVGVNVIINLEFKDMHEYYLKSAPPILIKKGGNINVPY